jgi:hypothetical protein
VVAVSLDTATASTVIMKPEEFDQARGSAAKKRASSIS